MHEHLRACIRDIGALQTDMWTKAQMYSGNRRVKDAGTQIYTRQVNKFVCFLFQKVSKSFYTIQCSHIKSEEEEGLQNPAFPVPSLRGL